MRKFLAPVLTDQAAMGVMAMDAPVATMSATGTTPGNRSVSNETLPDAQPAKSNPSVTA